jgi:hypothetical protein
MRSTIPVILLFAFACKEQPAPEPKDAPPAAEPAPAPAPEKKPLAFPGKNTLLLSQAQFQWIEKDGKKSVKPLDAKLLMLTLENGEFVASALEDPDSRVFHKAECVETEAGTRLLTIGATDAYLKAWQVVDGAWKAEVWWNPKFGGKWDRLRDFEIGNVDADPDLEIVIATHDQGVVAVGNRSGIEWTFTEASRTPDTFVHEIEIGDVDGDGTANFFATPSKPNKADKSQAGSITAFTLKKKGGFKQAEVAKLTKTHAKEILVADIDGDGTPELYTAVEAERGSGAPVEIRQYVPGKRNSWKPKTIATLEKGLQARVLVPADLTGSGRLELVTTTWKDGIWRLVPPKTGKGPWQKVQVDADSSGFEHAAGVADLDGDGTPELYVSADDQDAVRQYVWTGAGFAKKSIHGLEKSDLTWNITACVPTKL